jgi:hypothetical protein
MEARYKSVIPKSSTEGAKDRERDDALIERLRKSAITIEQGATEERSSQPMDGIDLTDVDRVLRHGESGPHLVGR